MSDIERKFLFVTGKGGVGKTTVSVALAKALTEAGRRVLLCVSDPGLVSELLGVSALGTELTLVAPRLSAVVLESEAALRQYGAMMLRSETAYRTLFENRYARSFLAAIPGLHQWAVLGKAWFHSCEKLPNGEARFDTVVFDAPATGHSLEMLRVPKVIAAAATPGPLRRDAEKAWNMLQNPAESGIVLVTLPEELPIQETFDLAKELSELGLSASRIVLNGVMPALFEATDEARLAALTVTEMSAAARTTLLVALERSQIERLHREQQRRLRDGSTIPVTVLPRTPDASRPSGISALAGYLTATL
jgi:anion-transporting  ArsA/GET3 family ATPase